MGLYFNDIPIPSIADALGLYDKGEFNSASRSTVALLSAISQKLGTWSSVQENRLGAHLEFKVPVRRGKGKASHTDLMLISRQRAIAVEAKWTEPRYHTVSAWLNGTTNRREVLRGWLELLQPHSCAQLNSERVSDVVYQMLHRAASACATGRRPCLAYLIFIPRPDGKVTLIDEYRRDLEHLHEVLGSPPAFPFRLIEAKVTWTAEFKKLWLLEKNLHATGQAVRAALLSAPPVALSSVKIHRIGSHRSKRVTA